MLMAVNSLAKTLKLHRTLKGLETIATSEVKNAVTAAAGAPAATIASGAVEGEVIALSGRETVNVRNYLKNCGYFIFFRRRIRGRTGIRKSRKSIYRRKLHEKTDHRRSCRARPHLPIPGEPRLQKILP
jgi:hypothetical protein